MKSEVFEVFCDTGGLITPTRFVDLIELLDALHAIASVSGLDFFEEVVSMEEIHKVLRLYLNIYFSRPTLTQLSDRKTRSRLAPRYIS